jgi:MSHA biogenesis protein MshN
MSIINRMLQDLDRRQGTSDPDATLAMAQVRTVPAVRKDREWFWRIIAGLMIVAVGWVGWIAWQLQPREPVVTPQAFRAAEKAQRQPAPAPAQPAPAPVAEAKAPESKPAPAPAPAQPAPEPLKLAPVIETPIKEPAPKPAAKAPAKEAPKPAAKEPEAPAAKPAPVAQAAPRVEKRERVRSAEERAEADFRRGAALLNQGRAGDAEDSFAAALAAYPGHEAARQALVALHLEHRRIDEARRLLQEGLAVNPANTRFAAVLARIFVERKDYGAALDVISAVKGHEQDAALQALRGTVLQRTGRHAEASDAFRQALRVAPQAGPTWVALGISLEALGKRAEAAEAFRRAVALGPADSALAQFAGERLKALE